MNPSVRSEHTCSVWMSVDMPTCAALNEDIATDVCVIGSGIAGLTTAYRLLQEGKSVVVLESGTLGSGMTPLTTAHLSHVMDRGLSNIERLHGEQGTRLAVRSHTAAIEWIEDTAAKESIPCGFERVDGYLFSPFDGPTHHIEEEWAAARRAGLTNVTRYDSAPRLPFPTGPCLRFTRQAQFHPMKYLSGLARAIQQKGDRLFTNSHVTEVEAKSRGIVKTRTAGKYPPMRTRHFRPESVGKLKQRAVLDEGYPYFIRPWFPTVKLHVILDNANAEGGGGDEPTRSMK